MFIITQIDNQDKRKKERKVMLLVELLEVVDEITSEKNIEIKHFS